MSEGGGGGFNTASVTTCYAEPVGLNIYRASGHVLDVGQLDEQTHPHRRRKVDWREKKHLRHLRPGPAVIYCSSTERPHTRAVQWSHLCGSGDEPQ